MSAMTLRRWAWWLSALVSVAVLAVGVMMLRVGLAKADQLGSVIGSIIGVVGLGMAGFAIVLAVRADRRDTEQGRASGAGPSVTNSMNKSTIKMTRSTIKGPNIQIGQVGRDARIEQERM
jgi:hypothetical protein